MPGHFGQPLATSDSEKIRHRDHHAGFGEHGMDPGFQTGSDRDQLGAVTHQFSQLAGLRRSDPGFGQSAHPQQIGQTSRVAHVVLHSSIPESFDPQRMHQTHPYPSGLGHINRPIPAMGGLQHHLGLDSSLLELSLQRDRIVD